MELSIKEIYDKFTDDLKMQIENSNKKFVLSTIRVGENGGAKSFEKSILREASKLGVEVRNTHFEKNTSKEELLKYLDKQNNDCEVSGILVFTPLEIDFDQKEILNSIDISKDVDGLNIKSAQNLYIDKEYINVPTTAAATLFYLKEIVDLASKDILIINRSNIIGKPLFNMLIDNDATVTVAHSKTINLEEKIKNYDIVISAIGRANHFKEIEFKKDAILIDLGISAKDGKYYGDFDYKYLEDKEISFLPSLKGIGRLNANFIIRNTYLNGVKNDR